MGERTYWVVPYRRWDDNPQDWQGGGAWSNPHRFSSDELATEEEAMVYFRTQSRLDRQGKTLQFCVEKIEEGTVTVKHQNRSEIFDSVQRTRTLVALALPPLYPMSDWIFDSRIKNMKPGMYLYLFDGHARKEDQEFAKLDSGFPGPAFGPLHNASITLSQVKLVFMDGADREKYPFSADGRRNDSDYADLYRVYPGDPFENYWQFNGMFYRGMSFYTVKS